MDKLDAHLELMRRLWQAFVHVATEAQKRGVTVIIEWPQTCDYWRDPQVVEFMQRFSYTSAIVAGCMVNLRSKNAATLGVLVRKRWRLATNDAALARRLGSACDHAQ